jgi:hypothetical protein
MILFYNFNTLSKGLSNILLKWTISEKALCKAHSLLHELVPRRLVKA